MGLILDFRGRTGKGNGKNNGVWSLMSTKSNLDCIQNTTGKMGLRTPDHLTLSVPF